MKEKFVIATVACNTEYYYNCARNLIDNFIDDDDYQIILYTDNEVEFIGYTSIKIITQTFTTTFPYHNKFVYVNEIRKMGYDKICFIDGDMFLAHKEFKNTLKLIDFNPGFSYSRYTSISFNDMLNHTDSFKLFKNILDENNVYYQYSITPWEDFFVFNFNGIENKKIEELFQKYDEYRLMRESCAVQSQDDLKSEGIVLSLAAMNTEFPMHSSKSLFEHLKYFRDNHIPKYKDIDSLSKDVDFLILYTNDSVVEQENMADITIKFYKERFPQTIFTPLNNNPEDIIKVLKKSNNTTAIIIDNGSIMIDCRYVQSQAESIMRGQFEYIIPFSNKYNLPGFTLSNDHTRGMYMINKMSFLNIFKTTPWTSDKDRHDRLIEKNVKYKKTWGDLLCLDESNPVIKNKMI